MCCDYVFEYMDTLRLFHYSCLGEGDDPKSNPFNFTFFFSSFLFFYLFFFFLTPQHLFPLCYACAGICYNGKIFVSFRKGVQWLLRWKYFTAVAFMVGFVCSYWWASNKSVQAFHAHAFPSLHRTWIFFAACSPLCGGLPREFSCSGGGFWNEVTTMLQILISTTVCRWFSSSQLGQY